jgi:hypothetical protein
MEDLSWCAIRIAQAFLPLSQPVLLNGVLNGGGEVVFHVALETYCCHQHVTVFGDMTHTLACGTLYAGEEWAPVAVRPCKVAGAGGKAGVFA